MNDYRRRPGAVRVFGTSLEASFVEALERASLAFGAPRPEAAEGVARDTKEGERRAAPLILLEIEDAERLISFLESDA
ncbi:MAG TPA: hypothetical protein VK116_07315, partial [Planctomycetota bacterium]|nr:hypothetical protein [Planctomycetota bacterium]